MYYNVTGKTDISEQKKNHDSYFKFQCQKP